MTLETSTYVSWSQDGVVCLSLSHSLFLSLSLSFSLQFLLFHNRLHNSIAEGIRRDCAECPFENYHLQNVILACQPSEQSVHFQASIIDWASDSYPVPYILRSIQFRYNGSGEIIIRTANFTTTNTDSFLENLVLVPTNVSIEQNMVSSSGSGDRGSTDLEFAETTQAGTTQAGTTQAGTTQAVRVESTFGIKDETSSEIDIGTVKMMVSTANVSLNSLGINNPFTSDSVPRATNMLLILTAFIGSMLTLLQH